MDLEGSVPVQAGLVVFATALALLGCGHEAGLPLFVAVGVGALIWAGYSLAYVVRRRLPREASSPDAGASGGRGGEGRAIVVGLVGFGLPLAAAAVAWGTPSLDGLVFHSVAATWGAVLLVLMPVAILASSMVDWYLILPFVHGRFRWPAVWVDDQLLLPPVRRRRYAKYWIVHRALCEMTVAFSGALLLAIVFVAVGNAVSRDQTLPTAIESLGGSGIAFALVALFGPRIAAAIGYMLDQSAGLGEWVAVTKRDAQGWDTGEVAYTGLVVDVSVGAGIQIRLSAPFPASGPAEEELAHPGRRPSREVQRRWAFVRLKDAKDAQEAVEPHDPRVRDVTWREQAFKTKGEIRASTDWAGRLRAAASAAPSVAIGCLVAFVAIVAVQHVASGLDPLRHMVSEYANGSAGPLMVVGFALWAASLALAAVGVLGSTLGPRWRAALAVLLGIACLGAVVTASFATQTVAGRLPPGVEWAARGELHDAGSGLLILAVLAAALVTCFAPVSTRLRRLTVALLAAAVVLDVGLLLVGESVGGLRQRLLLAIGCAWQLGLLVWIVRRRRAETR